MKKIIVNSNKNIRTNIFNCLPAGTFRGGEQTSPETLPAGTFRGGEQTSQETLPAGTFRSERKDGLLTLRKTV